MLTQTQYELLSLDTMKKGIYDTTIKESPILQRIPQVDIVGKAMLYNIESSMAGAAWYLPGDKWTESVAVPIQRTTHLHILGGDADVDTFMNQTRSNVNDQMQLAITGKVKALSHEFEKQFVWGGTTSTPDGKSFDGVVELTCQNETTANQTTADFDVSDNVHIAYAKAGSGGTGALALEDMDTVRDLVKPGKPDFFLITRRTRKKLGVLARASATSAMRVSQDALGNEIVTWDGIDMLTNDWINDNLDNESAADWTPAGYAYATTRTTDYDNSMIIACKVGMEDLYIIQNGTMDTEPIGTLETKDAKRTRLKWYVGLCNPNIYAIGCLYNFNPDD